MSVQPLLDQLKHDASHEVSRRLAEARVRAAELLAAADAEQARATSTALDAHEQVLQAELDRRREALQLRCQVDELESRRRLVARVLSLARDRAERLAGRAGFEDAFCRLAARASEFAPEVDASLVCSPTLEAVASRALEQLGSAMTIRLDAAMGFGLAIEASAGALWVDATIDALLARAQPEIAIRLVQQHLDDMRRE